MWKEDCKYKYYFTINFIDVVTGSDYKKHISLHCRIIQPENLSDFYNGDIEIAA